MTTGSNVRRLVNRLAYELSRTAYETHRQDLTSEVKKMREGGQDVEQVAGILRERIEQLAANRD